MADSSKPETNLIYACSGAADVGEIADRCQEAAPEGVAKMTALPVSAQDCPIMCSQQRARM